MPPARRDTLRLCETDPDGGRVAVLYMYMCMWICVLHAALAAKLLRLRRFACLLDSSLYFEIL